jgi:hypothetical protein
LKDKYFELLQVLSGEWCGFSEITSIKLHLTNPLDGWEQLVSLMTMALALDRFSIMKLRPQGLKKYSDSYSTPDYLRPILGSKCLVMQTLGNYFGLGPLEETSESMFQVATRTFNLLYCFPFMLLIGLTSLASIYSQTPVIF